MILNIILITNRRTASSGPRARRWARSHLIMIINNNNNNNNDDDDDDDDNKQAYRVLGPKGEEVEAYDVPAAMADECRERRQQLVERVAEVAPRGWGWG